MAKAIVTGAKGFLGSYLTAQLKIEGFEVITIPHWQLYSSSLPEALECNPDYIIHLASFGNLASQKDEQDIFDANVLRTWYLLQLTKNIGYKGFVYISSSSVALPHQTIYSASKLACEAICKAFVDEYDKPIIIARPSTVIGVGEQKEHLIPKLINSCMTGEQMPFIPYPTHDFIDVRDVANALILLAKNAMQHRGEIFNISSGVSYNNEFIKDLVEKFTSKLANLTISPQLRNYDTTNWFVNNTKLRQLGWFTTISIEDTIKAMIDSYEA